MQSVQTKKEYYGWIKVEVEIGEETQFSVRDDARRVCQKMNEVVAKMRGLVDVDEILDPYDYDENMAPVYFHPVVYDYRGSYGVFANFNTFGDDVASERKAQLNRVAKILEMFVDETAKYSVVVREN